MNSERQLGKDIGTFYGARNMGLNPSGVHVESGFAEAHEESFRSKMHPHMMKAAEIIIEDNFSKNASCLPHLRALASTNRHHSAHVKEASDIVFDTIKNFHGLDNYHTKSADLTLPGILAMFGTGGLWALGAGAAGVGAAGGALYNMSKKEINEEEAQNEAKKRKIEYYKNLAEEINSNLEEKYEYS